MPLILPGNVASATASTTYDVANSCRFNGTDSSLTYTPGSTGNVDKWTLSVWLKKGWQKVETQVELVLDKYRKTIKQLAEN